MTREGIVRASHLWIAPARALGAILLAVLLSASGALAYDRSVAIDDSAFDPSPAGGVVEILVTVTNADVDPVPAGTLEITVPTGGTLTDVTGLTCAPGSFPAAGGSVVTCDVPALANENDAVTATLFIDAPNSGVLTTRVEVPDATDTEQGNNVSSDNTTITAGADLSVTVTAPPRAASGETIDFDVTVANAGPNALTSAVLSFERPPGVVGLVAPAGCTAPGTRFDCPVGALAVGANRVLTFTGQVAAASGSNFVAIGTVGGGAPGDAVATNNTDEATVAVDPGSDLSVVASFDTNGPILVGDTTVLTLRPRYTGEDPNAIQIVADIPAEFDIEPDAIVAPGWTVTRSGQQLTFTRPNGSGPGSAVSLDDIAIPLVANAPSANAVATATISAGGPFDPNAANDTSSDALQIEAARIDLVPEKTGRNPAIASVGDTYDFILRTRNQGTLPYAGTVTLTDRIPAGLTLLSIPEQNGWTCTPSGPLPLAGGPGVTVACERTYTSAAPLAARGGASPSIRLRFEVTQSGPIANGLTVSLDVPGDEDAAAQANNDITVGLTGQDAAASADLSVIKTADVSPIEVGEVQTFRIEVVNTGNASGGAVDALDVDVADLLENLISSGVGPTDEGFIDAAFARQGTASSLSCTSSAAGSFGRSLVCRIPTLGTCTPGTDCPVIDVRVRPGLDGGTRTNTASVLSQTTADPDRGNNTDDATFETVSRADVTVTKTATPSTVPAGQPVRYVVTPRNLPGRSTAAAVEIVDTLPAGVIFVSAVPTTGACGTTPAPETETVPGDTVACQFGALGQGQQQAVTITVRPTLATRGTTLPNSVTVSTATTEIDATNNDASAPVVVEDPDLDLLIQKSVRDEPITIGDTTVYTLQVTNNGPSAAENVVVTDPLPASRVQYVSNTTSPGGSCDASGVSTATPGGTLVCDFPYLAAQAVAIVEITIRGVAKGTVTNTAEVSSDEVVAGFDRLAGNNTNPVNSTVRTRASLRATSKTATPASVELDEDFVFTLAVDALTGPGLQEADGVVVSDTLPSGMRLTATPTFAIDGGAASNCTGAALATSFSCAVGTVAAGSRLLVTVPVEVVSIAGGTTLANTFTVTTTSRDVVTTDNSATGSVTVASSSLAGTVFRDFADDGGFTPGDTGVAGLAVTLTGTSFDGRTITRTVATNAAGDYAFADLPRGSYVVSRPVVPGANLAERDAQPGTPAGGTANGARQITGIALGNGVDAVDYDFRVVPQAAVGIAKRVTAAPTFAADGSFTVAFETIVRNLSAEPLTAMNVDDPLAGAAPLFGARATPTPPATGPLAPGEYVVTGAPSGTCGGLAAGFDGDGQTALATGFGLPVGGSCTIAFTVRARAASPAQTYENQAGVTATGATSGQTSTGPNANPNLADLSDDGATVDANGNSDAGDPGEDDPTPVAPPPPPPPPSVTIVKSADISGVQSPPQVGDVVRFAFRIVNDGPFDLRDVTVFDNDLPGLVLTGAPIPLLRGGSASLADRTDATTYAGEYALTQADVDAGEVRNQADVTGTDPFARPATDVSGTAASNDDETVVSLVPAPALALTKAVSFAPGSPPRPGDVATYTFTVTNVGNVTLNDVTVLDPLLDPPPATGEAIGTLTTGEEATFTRSYAITQADIDLGRVDNQATATGSSPGGTPGDVTDPSGATTGDDLPTTFPIAQVASISLVKTADTSAVDDGPKVGQVLTYAFAIANTGNVTLRDVAVTEDLPRAVLTGTPIAVLPPDATDAIGSGAGFDDTAYSATYEIDQADIDARQVVNDADVTGTYDAAGGGTFTVSAASAVTADLNAIRAVPEAFPGFTGDGGTTTSVLSSDTLNGAPADLGTVEITVIRQDPGVTLDPATGLITLAPGLPAGPYEVEYRICDRADPGLCSTTVETVFQEPRPAIEAVKTQAVTDDGDGRQGPGDLVTYTIRVANVGNVALSGVSAADTLTDRLGRPQALDAGPDFVSASASSPEGALGVGESATYVAKVRITQAILDGRGLSNSVTATALPVTLAPRPGFPPPTPGAAIADVSDDGDDGDGNARDDPTVLALTAATAPAGLSIVKTTPRDVVRRGEAVPFAITLRNDGAATIGPVDLLDRLPDGLPYVDGTARVDGAPAIVTVSSNAHDVRWTNLFVPAGGTTVVTLQARVLNGVRSGTHVNRAQIFDPLTGAAILGEASAAVRVLPEAVFDCGEVIGKVFADRDGDGRQGTPSGVGGITDQSYDGGKGGKAAPAAVAPDDLSEDGVPSARLVTVDGLVITTDAQGRFSVPCAALPRDRGSNFLLKLDDRSLPSGWRVTTENPRVTRLTPGMMTEMNFGVAPGRVVRVDLGPAAFGTAADGAPALSGALDAGLAQLVARLGSQPANLRLAYHLDAAAGPAEVSVARMRMALVERRVSRLARQAGAAPLRVEQVIVRPEQ